MMVVVVCAHLCVCVCMDSCLCLFDWAGLPVDSGSESQTGKGGAVKWRVLFD